MTSLRGLFHPSDGGCSVVLNSILYLPTSERVALPASFDLFLIFLKGSGKNRLFVRGLQNQVISERRGASCWPFDVRRDVYGRGV